MRSFIISIFLFSFVQTNAQKKQVNSDSLAYTLAMKIGDYAAAIDIQYRIISKDPSNVSKIFTLAELYFDTEQFPLCINTCYLALEKNTKHRKSWQMLAVCYQKENNSTGALLAYNKLDSLFPDAYNKYQKATLLFEKQRYQESLNELQLIINDSTTIQRSISINFQNEQNISQQQDVSLQAAAYNMAAFILMNHDEKGKAKALLERALQISPEFQLAIGNYKNLSKP
jgi:tetratricopeptide (TPR) repeat protein